MTQLRLIAIPLFAVALVSSGCTAAWVGAGVLGAGAYVALDRRDTSQLLKDQAIELTVTDAIYHTDGIPPDVHVSATSYNGLVLLTGEVPNVEIQQRAVELARGVANVRDVYNQITIGQALPLGERNRDVWLTSQVKAKLMSHRGVLTRVKVVTNDGVVYLLGLSDQAEATDAYQVANKIEGVDKVIPVFEIKSATELAAPAAPANAPMAQQPAPEPVPAPVAAQPPVSATATENGEETTLEPYVLQPPIKVQGDK